MLRWLACSIAALAVWAAAAPGASARTGLEEPLGLEADAGTTVQINARRSSPEAILEAERAGAPSRDDQVAREEPEAGRTFGCTGREACARRRGGAAADAIPDRALMRQRAIL